jgi:putative ABC transport system permease protein
VGRVAHVKNYGVDEDSRVELYLPFLQSSASGFTLVARTDRAPGTVAAAMRQALRAVDRDLPIYSIRPLDEIVAERSAERRLAALLIGVFATVALVLAAVGIYGVMSYAVAQRTQEIGIRMALGADRAGVIRMVLSRVAVMVGAGIVCGGAASLWASRFAESLLFGLPPRDPLTLAAAAIVLGAVGALAGWLPARRASRLDPARVLREG